MKKFLTVLLLSCLVPLLCGGQGRFYTKKERIADFPTKTTRVVLGGNPIFDAVIREEIALRWRISPYEFCSPSDYDAQKKSQSYYFLRLTADRDFSYITLTKGGPKSNDDPRLVSFDVVSIPIGPSDNSSLDGVIYMGALIDILQSYIEKALISEAAAFRGLRREKRISGKKVVFDRDEACRLLGEGADGCVAGIIIPPSEKGRRTHCYKMLVATDTHDLYLFRKQRIYSDADIAFSDRDKKKYLSKN